MLINNIMTLKKKLYFRWIVFLSKVRNRISSILEEHEPPKQTMAWPLLMNEWYDFEHEPRMSFKKIHYLTELHKLKEEVKRSLSYNNYRLTYDQILKLEDIKRNLRLLHE